MIVRPFIISTLLIAAVFARGPAAPTTAPVTADQWPTLIKMLGDRDAAARDSARNALMQLTRDDLPALEQIVRERQPFSPMQRLLLHDVVVHVFLTGKHNFSGLGPGYLGITLPPQFVNDPPAVGAIVQSRIIGYDGFRTLEVGDVITAVARGDGVFKTVEGIADLRSLLTLSRAGEWIKVRLIRDGAERETALRLGPLPESKPGVVASEQTGDYAAGDHYWAAIFVPAMRAPTTKPTSNPTRPSL